MRFNSTNKQSAAPSWRIVLWMTTLLPMMLMASWFARNAHSPHVDSGRSGHSPADARRLDRILHAVPETPVSHSRDDSVRVAFDSYERPQSILRPEVSTIAVTLDKSLFDSVSDRTFGISTAERQAYEGVLALARKVPQTELERAARQDVPFAVLMLEADQYRGDVFTIEGDVRRLHRITTVPGVAGSLESFEAWIFTADSGLNPYRVICTSLPEGFPLGDQLDPPIRVRATGYFFKRYSYATTGDHHTAPLLLAKTLVQIKVPKPVMQQPLHRSRTLTTVAVCVLLVLAIGWTIVGPLNPRPKRDANGSSTIEPLDCPWSSEGLK